MNSTLGFCLAMALMTSCVLCNPLKFVKKCQPGVNCKPPNCRCWDDKSLPGNLKHSDVPMMILLSFDYGINNNTVKNYDRILNSLSNPNLCKAKGTFFVQALNSAPETLEALYKRGNEMAINSARGIIPTSKTDWEDNFIEVIELLNRAKVPENLIAGVRAPQLFNGGDDEFEAMRDFGMKYDASCVTVRHSDPKHLLWPYTTDFTDLPVCSIGHTPKASYPGIWEFPVPTFNYKGRHCPTPSACIAEVKNADDVFQLFFDAFDSHYYHTKAPFVIDIDANWVTNDNRVDGTLQFLELVGAYTDTWILTMSQALEWIKDPQSLSKIAAEGYKPWDCPQEQKVAKKVNAGAERQNLPTTA